MSNEFSPREQIVEVVNKLFVYTDDRCWDKLVDEVFADSVLFDMSSAGGGEPESISGREICDKWDKGLSDIDSVHYQAGNHLVKISGTEARVNVYAIALHFKEKAVHIKTKEFVGTYELALINSKNKGWRIRSFKYNLKFMDGNVEPD